MIPTLTRPFLLLVLVGSLEPVSQRIQEPPLRARVTLDGEIIDMTLGIPARTADGRPVSVELLPTRFFEVEDAFSFGYPKDWSFFGSVGSHTPAGSWWTFSGEGTNVYLRRHDADANATLLEYVSNLEALGDTRKRAATQSLGGRDLEGWAVEIEVGSVGPDQTRIWVQEVFAWSQEEGVSWLISLQRDVSPKKPAPLTLSLPEFVAGIDEEGNLTIVEKPRRFATPIPITIWRSMLTDFQWR
jgi:hypothetical protein